MTKEELKNISVEKQEGSTVKIAGEIPYTYLEKHRDAALKHIGKDIQIDGFRKGSVPEKVIIERVGEAAVIAEMAERALSLAYPLIIAEHDIDAVGYPQIGITKIAKDNPLGFTATVAVLPDVTLPDYKEIAKDINAKKPSDEVTDEDVETQIKDILRQKTAYERLQKKAQPADDHEHGEDCDHDHEEEADEAPIEDAADIPVPELTDELVQTLGQPGQFTTVADFKAKIREHLEIQKKQDASSMHRGNLTDAIVEKSEIELPQVMIDAELNQMFAQMEEDLKRASLSTDDYLGHIKKTRDDLKAEWAPTATKRAKLQLVLNEIAQKESIEADAGEVDQQVSALLEQYKDADEARVRIYVQSMLTNEKVMQMLETA
ncbi:trigger factor [Candidatus Parcubacteria bacterium]|uniref:Trigger factor n=1 Tax=Candidatus Kaiserbacteria bacterium CG10_big_fil_rev_8_21_14_0_10_47_16 TaxID=1974608 RepID=A0A2H0UDV6_9BACT|nr:trigger factor [Candidatus Parcubacteria bacterium]PIR84571.1 MAG: hypothetical protein COU16_03270 [Candidatus Kaiserbacteria bacterium CG10_big_fil_rev_8_21_14_0_10_47_16]